MIEITKILHNKNSVPFISFIIGLGVVILLFSKPFGSQKFLSLPVADIHGKVVKVGEKCYSYTAEDSLCPAVNKDGRRSN